MKESMPPFLFLPWAVPLLERVPAEGEEWNSADCGGNSVGSETSGPPIEGKDARRLRDGAAVMGAGAAPPALNISFKLAVLAREGRGGAGDWEMADAALPLLGGGLLPLTLPYGLGDFGVVLR